MQTLRLRNNRIIEFPRMEMMGIVNVTPDSFYAGSRAISENGSTDAGFVEAAFQMAAQHIAAGAQIIDIGGESTRPGAAPVTADEEIARVCPVVRRVREAFPETVISVDTYRAETAAAALDAGADMINDISGLTFDPDLAKCIAKAGAAVVIMHTKGRPDTMQKDPHYDDVVGEVYAFLERQISYAVSCGIGRDQIMTDLGIGFGKTVEHNLQLLRNIDRFKDLGCPHLLAVSRKSLIGRVLKQDDPAQRLPGTLALTAYAASHGIACARVHDVRENLDVVEMLEALKEKTRAIIAIGSNMGDRKYYIDSALQQIEEKVGHILAVSDIIETKAYGYTDQADFLNLAIMIETDLEPRPLLNALHEIEADLDRVRVIHWGPRTIDLDIIFYGSRIIDEEDLHIPHIEFALRDFVLRPICQIAPDLVDPRSGKTIRVIWQELMDKEENQ